MVYEEDSGAPVHHRKNQKHREEGMEQLNDKE